MKRTMTDSSKEFLDVSILPEGDVEQDDLTVQLAIVPRGQAVVEGNWTVSAWDPDRDWVARLLIGPGSGFGALVVGTYNVWVRIADVVEVPVRLAGTLRITPTA